MRIPDDLKDILPETAAVNNEGHLIIGGCDVVGLPGEFGTPLYLFDEATLRHKCREYRREFSERYPHTMVIYACKAFLNRARSVDFPMEKVYFRGNNKTQLRGYTALPLLC